MSDKVTKYNSVEMAKRLGEAIVSSESFKGFEEYGSCIDIVGDATLCSAFGKAWDGGDSMGIITEQEGNDLIKNGFACEFVDMFRGEFGKDVLQRRVRWLAKKVVPSTISLLNEIEWYYRIKLLELAAYGPASAYAAPYIVRIFGLDKRGLKSTAVDTLFAMKTSACIAVPELAGYFETEASNDIQTKILEIFKICASDAAVTVPVIMKTGIRYEYFKYPLLYKEMNTASIETLSAIGEKVVPYLVEEMENGDTTVERFIVNVLFKMEVRPPERVKGRLIKIYSDKKADEHIRIRAARVLEKMGSPEYLKEIAKKVLELERTNREAEWTSSPFYAESIALLGGLGFDYFIDKMKAERYFPGDLIFRYLVPEFGDRMIEMMRGEDIKLSYGLSRLFNNEGSYNPAQLEKMLKAAKWFCERMSIATKDDDRRLYFHAMDHLFQTISRHREVGLPFLVKEIDSVEETEEREYARALLGTLGNMGQAARPAVGKLLRFLKSEDEGVRWQAVRALHSIGSITQDIFDELTYWLLESGESGKKALLLKSYEIGKTALKIMNATYTGEINGATALPVLDDLIRSDNVDAEIKHAASELRDKIEGSQL